MHLSVTVIIEDMIRKMTKELVSSLDWYFFIKVLSDNVLTYQLCCFSSYNATLTCNNNDVYYNSL